MNQGASNTRPAWYRPKNAAAAQPATIAITGAQSRRVLQAPNTSATNTSRVTAAILGAATGAAPSGACVNISKATGMTATAINISTMPDTTGVIMRRNNDKCDDSTNWNNAETITRFIISATPPADKARIQTAIAVAALVEMRKCPAPMNPVRKDCNSVMSPQTSSAAKIVHDR